MAASEFAKRLAQELPEASFIGRTALRDYVPRQRMIDAELQGVREVLQALKTKNGCWCNPMVSASAAPLHHSVECDRARELMSRLTPRGE